MGLSRLDRRGTDRLLLAGGLTCLLMAAFLYVVVPEGRVVFELRRTPTFSKRDLVAIGLCVSGIVSLLSRSRMTAARHIVGFALVGAALVWLLKPHRFQGPVVAIVNRGHGIHENDWLAVFPGLVGAALLLRRPGRRSATSP
ncbi:MAG: hypothetical protein AB7Q42_22475 [Acidimicrobiia bacterium]